MRARSQRGFTFIEFLIVVVVIGIIAAIVIPAVVRAQYHGAFRNEFGFSANGSIAAKREFVDNHLHDLRVLVSTKFGQRDKVMDGRPKVDGLSLPEANAQMKHYTVLLTLADAQVQTANDRYDRAVALATRFGYVTKQPEPGRPDEGAGAPR